MTTGPTVGIAGVGLIGASIGLRAVAGGWRTIGWDPNAEHLADALRLGALGAAAQTFDALVASADILVLAAPLDATVALLERLAAGPVPRADLILDVASVKAPVARAGANLRAFVPTHPIAGSEQSGPRAARADLFAARVWTFAPEATPAAVARARAFIEAMGAVPHALSSAEHDRVIAFTSHLPQIVSVALGARLAADLDDPDVSALCGTGIRSMLRLGASSWPIWRAIVAANGAAIAQEVRGLASVLSAVADGIDSGRTGDLADDFTASAAAFARLNGDASNANAVTAGTHPHDERPPWIDGSHSAPR